MGTAAGVLLWALAAWAEAQAPPGAAVPAPGRVEGCLGCHEGIEPIDEGRPGGPVHGGCASCHRGDPAVAIPDEARALRKALADLEEERRGALEAKNLQALGRIAGDRRVKERELRDALAEPTARAHAQLARDPADPAVVRGTCGACHQEIVERHLRSLHSTAGGIIEGVRLAYGQAPAPGPEPSPAALAAGGPPQDGSPESLLRRRCLACHAGVSPDREPRAFYRALRERLEQRAAGERIRAADDERRKKGQQPLAGAERDEIRRKARRPPLPPGDHPYFEMPFGAARGAGCSACHLPYHESGLSASGDAALPWHERLAGIEAALERGAPGEMSGADPAVRALADAARNRARPLTEGFTVHPAKHAFSRTVSTAACLACHHCDFGVGPDFEGLQRVAEAPDAPAESQGIVRIHGAAYVRVRPDVHGERGFSCADCHRGADVHGDGSPGRHAAGALAVRCETCHGTVSREADGNGPGGKPFPGLARKGGGWVFRTHEGKELRAPQASAPRGGPDRARAHAASHARLACQACHAPSALLAPGLRVFEDAGPDAELVERNKGEALLAFPPSRRSRDLAQDAEAGAADLLLPGRVAAEPALSAAAPPPLGVDASGRIVPLRPGPAILLTRIDREGRAAGTLSIAAGPDGSPVVPFRPFTPHGIRREARGCGACHGNPAAAGLPSGLFRAGDGQGTVRDLDALVRRSGDGFAPAASTWVAGARTLSAEEIRGLLGEGARPAPSPAAVFAALGAAALAGLGIVALRRRGRQR